MSAYVEIVIMLFLLIAAVKIWDSFDVNQES